jgi:hypothetical protein
MNRSPLHNFPSRPDPPLTSPKEGDVNSTVGEATLISDSHSAAAVPVPFLAPPALHDGAASQGVDAETAPDAAASAPQSPVASPKKRPIRINRRQSMFFNELEAQSKTDQNLTEEYAVCV